MTPRYEKPLGLLLAALSAVGFASTFVAGTALTREHGVSPLVLSFLRFSVAGGVMFAWESLARHRRARLFAVSLADWCMIAWLGPVGTSIMAWCVFMGCAHVSTANASMADALVPLLIFGFASMQMCRIAFADLACLMCGFVGALLVMQIVGANGLALQSFSLGDVYVLFGAVTWAVYTVCGKGAILRLGVSAFTTWTMLVGALAAGAVLPFGDFAWPTDLRAWLLTFALSLFSTLMPFWTWNAAHKYLPMSVLSVTAYFIPVVTIGLAYLFLGESSTWLQALGAILVILSATIETRRHETV